jgi:hypothetical protein
LNRESFHRRRLRGEPVQQKPNWARLASSNLDSRKSLGTVRERNAGQRWRLAPAAVLGVAIVVLAVLLSSLWRPGSHGRLSSGPGGPSGGEKAAAEDADAAPGSSPTVVELAPGRFRGPWGIEIEVPSGWKYSPGPSRELWAVLQPAEVSDYIPRIGVGTIETPGLSPDDAMLTTEHFLDELFPEITSTEEVTSDGLLSRGSGFLEGREVVQVRRLYPHDSGVIVVWGLFPKSFPTPAKVVSSVLARKKD